MSHNNTIQSDVLTEEEVDKNTEESSGHGKSGLIENIQQTAEKDEKDTNRAKKLNLYENNSSFVVTQKVQPSVEKEVKSISELTTPMEEDAKPENKSESNYIGGLSLVDVASIASTQWPQNPILLTPTPGSGTYVKAVRFASSMTKAEHLMDGSKKKLWWHELEKHWSQDQDMNDSDVQDKAPPTHSDIYGNSCILPINNGNEPDGKSLVVDFESELFEGTLQVRIRNTSGTTSTKYDDNNGFFVGKESQYQCVVSGRFKKEGIPMTECVTGQAFAQPLNTPPAYITKGAIKLVSFFAPRLQADLNCDKPSVLSPLGSTAQTIQVDEINETMICSAGSFRAIDTIMITPEEPTCSTRKLIELPSSESSSSTSISRAKERKKVFDKLCAKSDKANVFRTDRVYTFEFLQHLFDYGTMELNLGGILGKTKINGILNGQPLSIMAAHQSPDSTSNRLWSFDIWHKSIF